MSGRPTKKSRGKILIVGDGQATFLSLIRSFGRKGFEVHVANEATPDLALYSRYITKAHIIAPSPAVLQRKADILRIMLEEKFDLVIPVGDYNVIPFHLFRSEYEASGRIELADEHAFRVTNSKILTCQLARSLGIPVPRTEILKDLSDTSAVLSGFTLPVMLKPPSSYTPENLEEKRLVKRTDTREQSEQALRGMLLYGPVLVQEYFEGSGIGLELLAHQGIILVSFQHIRIHEEGTHVGSTYRMSQPVDATLLAAAEKMVAALHYTGVAMFEFRKNPYDTTWVLIEINARFWGSLPLSLACGVDFPCYLYEMLVGGRREFPQKYRVGLYCRNTSWDLQWFVNTAVHTDSSYHKKAYPVLRYILEWGNILLLREKNDVFVLDDPVPGIQELMRILRKGGSMVRKKINRTSSPVHRSPQEHTNNVPAAVKNSHSVLFVCYGNICRSPFAEAYFRTLAAPGFRVTSCGYYPVADRRCTAEAVFAAKRYGVDLSGHRSRVVSDALIQESDVIFVFDEENLQNILTSYPESRDKVWFLSAVTQKVPAIIADPYGKDLAAYEEVYEEIAGNIRVLVSWQADRTR